MYKLCVPRWPRKNNFVYERLRKTDERSGPTATLVRRGERWRIRGLLIIMLISTSSIILPWHVFANVVMSEIAWMGSSENASAEWIELHNTGGAVDVTGWTLTSADGQPAITLEGTIASGAYALLERTSDDTVPGVTALLTYTGALGNDGEVLTLATVEGTPVDRVDGGEQWSLGGDNTEKLTLQRAGSSWVTAPGTPGSANAESSTVVISDAASASDPSESSSDTATQKSKAAPSAAASTKSTAPAPAVKPPALFLDIGAERTVAIGAPVRFVALTTSETGKSLDLDTVLWNFGDGSTAEGRSVSHRYEYEGDHVVTAHATRPGLRGGLTADQRIIVHVREAPVTIAKADTLSIQLANTGTRDIDLSGFFLVAGNHSFKLPEGTVLLAGSSVRLPARSTKLVVTDPHKVALFYPNRTLAAWYGDARMEDTPSEVALLEDGDGQDVVVDDEDNEEGHRDEVIEEIAATTDEGAVPDGTSGTVNSGSDDSVGAAMIAQAFGAESSANAQNTNVWWYILGLTLLVGLTIAVVFLVRDEQMSAEAVLEAEVAEYEIDEVPIKKRTRRREPQDALY